MYNIIILFIVFDVIMKHLYHCICFHMVIICPIYFKYFIYICTYCWTLLSNFSYKYCIITFLYEIPSNNNIALFHEKRWLKLLFWMLVGFFKGSSWKMVCHVALIMMVYILTDSRILIVCQKRDAFHPIVFKSNTWPCFAK